MRRKQKKKTFKIRNLDLINKANLDRRIELMLLFLNNNLKTNFLTEYFDKRCNDKIHENNKAYGREWNKGERWILQEINVFLNSKKEKGLVDYKKGKYEKAGRLWYLKGRTSLKTFRKVTQYYFNLGYYSPFLKSLYFRHCFRKHKEKIMENLRIRQDGKINKKLALRLCKISPACLSIILNMGECAYDWRTGETEVNYISDDQIPATMIKEENLVMTMISDPNKTKEAKGLIDRNMPKLKYDELRKVLIK